MAIEAAHYGQARQVLKEDLIVQDMALGLAGVPLDEIAHDYESPRFHFMQSANAEYARRGGTNQAHIGAVAEALLMLLKEQRGA